jgi:S1-C subfamily serine protease
VAISEDLAMTNCHVIDNPSNEIVIGSARMDAPSSVELVAVNIDADRCVVKGRNLRLRPVAGIRAFDSLQIGEPLYAIGNPQRLQWTISDGLLSGKRIDGEYRWLQTTAPISPGSSGGGLFDSRGNLVGITTKSMVGLWGRNQNLNMAIPAEDFWK